MVELILPWPPSVNHYKKVGALTTTKSGKLYQRRVDTMETKVFYYQVWVKIREFHKREGTKFAPRDTISYCLEVDLHPPHDKRYDADNYLKVLLDSLVRGGLIKDDSQITRLIVTKKDIIPQGQTVLRIYELGA